MILDGLQLGKPVDNILGDELTPLVPSHHRPHELLPRHLAVTILVHLLPGTVSDQVLINLLVCVSRDKLAHILHDFPSGILIILGQVYYNFT